MATVLVMCMQMVLAAAGGTPDLGEWTSHDIGQVATAGTATYNPEVMIWTVRGGGTDIWGGRDSFQYVSRLCRGDGFIVAKVESVSKTSPWAKCGVMIRESADPGARFAAIYATPEEGVRFQARASMGDVVICDTLVATNSQRALKAPVWVKLERKGNQFYGYYATDRAGKAWTPIVWRPPAIDMPRTVCAGMAACSVKTGVLCEARFSNVVVSDAGYEITSVDVLANPREARVNAYQNLERLGNWRDSGETLKRQGNLIASSLFAIARTRELGGEPASAVLPDYYRIIDLLPDSPSTVDVVSRIAILDGGKGLEYATKCLEARPPEDKDRFYETVMNDFSNRVGTPEGEAVIASFVEYVAKGSRFTLLEQVIGDLGSEEHGMSVCMSLIQAGVARPSNVQTAVVGLRCMVLRTRQGQKDNRLQELLKWVTTQYKDTKLSPYAMAALADLYYEEGSYAKVIEVFQPELFSGSQPEPQLVESIENALASYRANTLLQATIKPERIYRALGEKAGESGRHVVNLHCQRKIAELNGLSLESFEQSALKGVKRSESGPENEVWFWKGWIAASEGDLGAAAAAYERFLAEDGKSVLAARAYYDVARAKMAVGEDAKVWITKAKALSPCDVVIRLEQRLSTTASARG